MNCEGLRTLSGTSIAECKYFNILQDIFPTTLLQDIFILKSLIIVTSYEPEELEGVYLSFDALYLLAKKPPSFRKEWLEEGKVRIVHICEIHDAWRSCPLNSMCLLLILT